MRRMMAAVLLLGLPAVSNAQRGRTPITEFPINRTNAGELMGEHPELFAGNPQPFDPVHPVAPGPGAEATVPVLDLKVPWKASKEYQRSDKALRAGNLQASAEHLEKALAVYPEWALAHHELGALYATMRDYDKSVRESEKAVALDPQDWQAVNSIAAVLCVQRRYAEAELVARRALQMKPQGEGAQFLLGMILVLEGNYSDEAKGLLEKSKGKYPRALMFLAKAEMERGEKREAVEALREYLGSREADLNQDRKMAEEWLARAEGRTDSR